MNRGATQGWASTKYRSEPGMKLETLSIPLELVASLGEQALQPPTVRDPEANLELVVGLGRSVIDLEGSVEVVHGRRIGSRMEVQLPDFPESLRRTICASCRWLRPRPLITVAELSHLASLGREG